MKKTLLFTMLFCFLLTQNSFSQERIINDFLKEQQSQLDLSRNDIESWVITSQSTSRLSKVQYVYIQQTHKGIPIFNAVSNFSIKDDKVLKYDNSFIKNVANKVNTTTPNINAENAINDAAKHLGINLKGKLELLEKKNNNSYVYKNTELSYEEIPVNLVYQPLEDGKLALAWELNIAEIDGRHYWNVRVDALDGKILDKNDMVIACQFDSPSHSHKSEKVTSNVVVQQKNELLPLAGERYNVYELPVESPNHGSRTILTEPHNLIASPYGWHDIDGSAGAEYTITRGNNVYAQLDDDALNNTFGYSPDAGSTLNFDYPITPVDANTPQSVNVDASLTNLFYSVNTIHDIYYQYGFDEIAGNFQENNYGKGGIGGDSVIADGQDGEGRNNAYFTTPVDGQNPRMEMYLWNSVYIFRINEGDLTGNYDARDSNFTSGGSPTGVKVTEGMVRGDLAIVDDGTSAPTEACSDIINGSEIAGKIAVIRRGGNCSYVDKVKRAQDVGAVGVVMVNNVGTTALFTLTGVTTAINIPAISINKTNGEDIIAAIENEETVNATLSSNGPDGSYDNGIIGHEFGHGISRRLIGGPNNVNCMYNNEQLGEGWSDFFGLVITMEQGDQGEDKRGVGTYAMNQPVDGDGIRKYPYSTDTSINPFTFGDSNTQTGSHQLGTVWATFLWDLNWAMIEEYGFDPDFYNGTGGNNKTIALVIEGLKNTACSSGFEAARDGILEADRLLYDGENQCLIWKAFADRGLGYSASSGSTYSTTDQVEAFDMPPTSVLNCELGVEDIKAKDFTVTPNPSNGLFNVLVNSDLGSSRVNIYSMDGKLVHTQSIDLSKSATINASSLNTGVYVLKIKGDGFEHTEKLIIK